MSVFPFLTRLKTLGSMRLVVDGATMFSMFYINKSVDGACLSPYIDEFTDWLGSKILEEIQGTNQCLKYLI